MNIAFFLTLKKDVAFLYDDFSLRQGLEKMKYHGYSAIPVISRSGKYIGTVSEGDFLWYFINKKFNKMHLNNKHIEKVPITEIIKTEKYKCVTITAAIDELINMSLNQNFVPVVDDCGSFVGIVLRKDIIKHFSNRAAEVSGKI